VKWLGWLFVLALTGCATQPVVIQPQAASVLPPGEYWKMTGRFGASHDEESWSGGIEWRQQGEGYFIQLSGPLGQGAVQLSGDDRSAQLKLAEDKVLNDGSAELLLWQHTGWRVPFAGMRYWMQGKVAPLAPIDQQEFDQDGRLVRLNQSGWRVDFRRYVAVNDQALPSKMLLQHDGISVRLVVDQWELSH